MGGRRPGPAVDWNVAWVPSLLLAAISAGIFWLVWIYGNGLRDARYLDGWLLAGGMGLQLGFHIAIKSGGLTPKWAARWRQLHIFIGYVLIAAFVSHCDFSLPDTAFEWALWAGFTLVTLSGLFGAYLAWSLQKGRGLNERLSEDRIATRRAELAQAVQAVVAVSDPDAIAAVLPAAPYQAWIADLYTKQLRNFFEGKGFVIAHLIGSQRKRKRLTDEIDSLSRYVDHQSQEKLDVIKTLVVEKDKLDDARVQHWLTKGWLVIHVPLTYALVVLSVLHVLVVYAFSSGAR